MEARRYLGHMQPVGEHLKYLVYAGVRRDRCLGWPAEQRRRNVRLVAYNSRYLILPWVRAEHLASHLGESLSPPTRPALE